MTATEQHPPADEALLFNVQFNGMVLPGMAFLVMLFHGK